MSISVGAGPVLDSSMIKFFFWISFFRVSSTCFCFSCFLAHFEGWRWNRWAEWEGTAPNSSKETGKAQVHAWGKSPRTATPASSWVHVFLLFFSISPSPCRPGSVSSSSIRMIPAFPGLLNLSISYIFFLISKNLFFFPFPLFEGVSLPSFLWCDEEDPSNLTVRNFDMAGYLLSG